MRFRSLVVAALASACLALPLYAQEATAGVDPAARVAKAIEDYAALKGDAQKAVQRRRAIVWLGEIDHPDAVAFLLKELAAAGDSAFAAVVLEALGKVARPQLQAELTKVLARASAPVAVRLAAATVIVRSGERALDAMLAMATAPDAEVPVAQRDAVIAALIDSGIDRALRGLVPMLVTDGPVPPRLKLLRRMDAVHGLPPLSVARIRLVQEGDLELAAVAWRQLTIEKHERARSLTLDVLERVVGEPRATIAAELIGGLVRVRDVDYYPVLLRFGSVAGEIVRKALRSAAAAAAEDPALVKWLMQHGLDEAQPAAREAAKLLLTEAPSEAVRPLVERIRADLRAGKKKALDLAVGLHDLLAKDPSWRQDLALMAASTDFESRMLGLSMLLELGSDAGVATAQQSVAHKQWEMRSLCYRYLTRCRDVGSIPLLIARFGKEDGRLGSELNSALFAHTGTRCLSRKEWDAWWQKNQVGFVLPHAETVRIGSSGTVGNTMAYHDIPIVSSHLSFLIDHSGSMIEKIGTDRRQTRLEAAKDQLARVVQQLPDTTFVNLIPYETAVTTLWDQLRKLTNENRDDLLDRVRRLPLAQGTNIFDALEKAFEDPKVDTIYLLTDGQPSAGRVRTTDAILEEVRRWNRTRQIVIHCIGFGLDSDLLKRLAAENGGTYKYVH